MKSFISQVLMVFCTFGMIFSFPGCIDEPVQNDNYKIRGRVYGYSWLIYLVSTGDYPIVSTNRGNFEVEAFSVPYDLTVSEEFGIYPPRSSLKILDITNNNPRIVYDEEYPYRYDGEICNVTIKFPVMINRKMVCTKFISEEKFETNNEFQYLHIGDSSRNLSIRLYNNNSSIHGKIYYLEAAYDPRSNSILSYDKFGIKDVILHKGENPDIIFSNEEIVYNPDEYLMRINLNLPSYLQIVQENVSLSHPNYYKDSDLELSIASDIQDKLLVPILPGKDFKIKVKLEYGNRFIGYVHWMYFGGFWKYFQPGEDANIYFMPTYNLILPQEDAENVTDTTTFEIYDNNGPAVYEYSMLISGRLLKLYTNKKKLHFGDFRARSFVLENNTHCIWFVRKFPGYNNVDEFLSQPFTLDNRYNYIEMSDGKSFKTAP